MTENDNYFNRIAGLPRGFDSNYSDTLLNVLKSVPVAQTIADATDVPGVRLEWLNGAWYGDCGFPSAAQHSALLAANAYNSLGLGSRMTLPSGPVTWRGAGAGGWVADSLNNKSVRSSIISVNLWDGVEALVDQYIDVDGSIKAMGGYAVSNYISVAPGDKLLICNGQPTLDKVGGYYNGTTWVSQIITSNTTDGIYTVPAGCNQMRITTRRTNQSDYVHAFVYKINKTLSVRPYSSLSSIGDSICRGFRATKPFTSIVAESLGINAANVDNNGIDSSTIAQSANSPISARMSQLSPADLVLFEGGGNDFNLIPVALGTISDTANTTFYGALNVCAAYLRANFPLATIVWVTVPRWRNWATLNSQSLTMDAYMDAFKAVAVRNGFVVADAYSKFSLEAYPIGYQIASDYAHLNDIGHQLVADVILGAIGA